jgi:SAM-dependent methyltransferase
VPFTVREALQAWWSRHRTQHGFFGALRHCAADLWEFARDSTPARRRARFGDIDFDCDYRVNTTAAGQSWQIRLRAHLAGAPYQPTDPALFHEMMRALESVASAESPTTEDQRRTNVERPFTFNQFTFLDIGSGKGRALLLASDYPFRKIIGVELLPELHREAEQNIARYRSPNQRCFNLGSRCADVRDFEFPSDSLVIYLFNPLPEPDLAHFISRLENSLRANPRPVYLVYHNPLLEHVLARSPFLRKLTGTHQYAIYSFQ